MGIVLPFVGYVLLNGGRTSKIGSRDTGFARGRIALSEKFLTAMRNIKPEYLEDFINQAPLDGAFDINMVEKNSYDRNTLSLITSIKERKSIIVHSWRDFLKGNPDAILEFWIYAKELF